MAKRTLQQIADDLKELYATYRHKKVDLTATPEYLRLMKEVDEITNTQELERDRHLEKEWEDSK